MTIPIPSSRRKNINKISIAGCRENNLKNISIEIPKNLKNIFSADEMQSVQNLGFSFEDIVSPIFIFSISKAFDNA